MNYKIQKFKLNQSQYQIQILVNHQLTTFSQFTTLLNDIQFTKEFTKTLSIEFDYYFETNAIKSPHTPILIILSRIIMDAKQDFNAFKEFQDQPGNVIFFPNLTKDAYLIVPKPIKNNTNYLNLRTFLSSAPESQIIEFWSKIAHIATQYLKYNSVIYLKTHGFAVPWLHFRIQKNNKYYFTKETDYTFKT